MKPRPTHCKHGHEFTANNTYVYSNGRRACRACQRDRDRTPKRQEHNRINASKYRQRNPEKVRACKRKCREKKLESYREKDRRYRQSNPDKVRMVKRKCRESKPDWYRTKAHQYNGMRRARKLSQLGSFPIPEPDFIGLLWETDPNCYYCRKPLGALYHVEHKIPLSRPEKKPAHWEGLHDFRNLRLACADCNLRKHNKTVEEMMRCHPQPTG